MTAQLYNLDCRDVMGLFLENDSVDSIVTDPPYGLGFMGKDWDHGVPSVEFWRAAYAVLKPGGHLLAFGGSRTYHRMASAIEDAGFEIRDQIMWIYGSGFPKSRNISAQDMDGADAEQWAGWGTALKPAHEPICVARKPLAKGLTVSTNVLEHGTGAINIDACRVLTDDNLNGGTYSEGGKSAPMPGDERTGAALGMFAPGAKPSTNFVQPTGRWPANVIHDGSDEVEAAFPDAPGQMADASTNAAARKTQNTYGAMKRGSQEASAESDNDGVVGFKVKPGARRLDVGSAARFFYCAKTTKKDRNEGTENLPQKKGGMVSNTSGQHMTRRDEGYEAPLTGNNYPTVKPTALMAYLCRLITPAGGVVLDPFMGSGSTGKAAIREGFRFIGAELETEYFQIASARIAAEQAKVTQA